jgi:hypothetical protein
MLNKFPSTASAAKGIKETHWSHRLFVPHQEAKDTFVPLPKNLADFADNLLMITILKSIELCGYHCVISETELKSDVLKSDKSMYLAGYIACKESGTVGTRKKATNLYERGYLYCQTEAVLATVGGRNAHIRKCEHSVGKILSEMTGFTRENWGIRGALGSLFSAVPKPKVPEASIVSYMLKSGELIGKVVRNKLPYSNGGVYRKEELAYFDEKYGAVKAEMERFHTLLKNPNKDLPGLFWNSVDHLAQECKAIEKALGPVFTKRARILFRNNSKKKSDIKWNQLSLDDKITQIDENQFQQLFSPLDLPGFSAVAASTDEVAPTDYDGFIYAKYRIPHSEDNDAKFALAASFEEYLRLKRRED